MNPSPAAPTSAAGTVATAISQAIRCSGVSTARLRMLVTMARVSVATSRRK